MARRKSRTSTRVPIAGPPPWRAAAPRQEAGTRILFPSVSRSPHSSRTASGRPGSEPGSQGKRSWAPAQPPSPRLWAGSARLGTPSVSRTGPGQTLLAGTGGQGTEQKVLGGQSLLGR